jgi:hypothetical protein
MRMRVGNKTVLVFKINMTKSEPKQTKLLSSSALCWLSGRNCPSSSSSDLSHSRTRLLPKEAVLLVVFFGSKCHPSPLPLSSRRLVPVLPTGALRRHSTPMIIFIHTSPRLSIPQMSPYPPFRTRTVFLPLHCSADVHSIAII